MTTPRFDPYTMVHKGQRAKLFELTTRAGQLASGDHTGRAALVAEVEATLAAIAEHARAEDAHFGPLYEAAAPEIGARLSLDHVGVASEHGLVRGAARVALEGASQPADLAFYRALARFTGAYLAHLDVEEGSLAELWAKLDDDTIARAQGALVASHPRATVQFNLRAMLPAASAAERVAFLATLRRNMPAEAFAGVRALVGSSVRASEWPAADASSS